MPNNGAVAKCPYYERENQTMIFCESGYFSNDGVERYEVHSFDNIREKNRHKAQFCLRYPGSGCPYAKYMDYIYKED